MLRKTIGLFIYLILSTSSFAQLDFIDKIYSGQDGVNGIRASEGIANSHDYKNIYVGSQRGLSVFDYDSISNALIFRETHYYQTDQNYNSRDIQCIIISNNDKYLYAGSRHNGAINIYKRDTATGLLEHIMDYTGDASTYSFLTGLCNIRISDDDRFIYGGAYGSECISVMERNTNTGELNVIQIIRDHDPGGVPRPEVIKLSIDNNFVYVTSIFDNCISVFSRDTNTGLLSFVQKIVHEQNGVSGLNSIQGIEISDDNRFLYSYAPKHICLFERDQESGRLNFINDYENNSEGVSGIKGIYSMSFSDNNRYIYTTSYADSCLSVFERNQETGRLNQIYDSIWLDYWHPGSGAKTQDALLVINNHLMFTVYWESSIVTGNINLENGIPQFEQRIINEDNASIKGLRKANLAEVSSDQEFVYLATERAFMSVFKRDLSTGQISFYQEYKDFGAEFGRYFRIYSMLTLDDYLYVSMTVGDTNCIKILAMNAQDSLSIVKTITIEETGAPAYSGFGEFCVSKDREHLYTGTHSNLYHFTLNANTHSIVYEDFIDVGDIIGTNVGFDEIGFIGSEEYMLTSFTNMDRIAMLKRDTNTGEISELSVYRVNHVDELRFNHRDHMAISPDGKNMIVTFNSPPSFHNYRLDELNDTLIIDQIIYGEETSQYDTDELNQVAFDPTAKFLYAGTLENGCISLYIRDTITGFLDFVDKFCEEQNGFQGLDMTRDIAFGGQGDDVFILSWSENSISTLKMGPYLGKDKHVCEKESVRLQLPYAYSEYLWSTGQTSSYIDVDTSGLYWVEITDPYGILNRDSVEVFLHFASEISLGNDTTLCEGKSLVLNAGSFVSFLWNDNSNLSYLNVDKAGKYSVIVENEFGCFSFDTIKIEAEIAPDLLPNNANFCDPDTIVLAPINTYNNSVWNNSIQSDSLLCNKPGIYTLSVISENSCVYRDTIIVNKYIKPTLPSFISVPAGDYVSFVPEGGPFESVIWQDSINVVPWVFNPSILSKDSISIKAEMLNIYGCRNTDTTVIFIDYSQVYEGNLIDKVFPNPTRGDLTVWFKRYFDLLTISTYDIKWKLLNNNDYSNISVLELKLNNLSPGIYYLNVKAGNINQVIPIILVK